MDFCKTLPWQLPYLLWSTCLGFRWASWPLGKIAWLPERWDAIPRIRGQDRQCGQKFRRRVGNGHGRGMICLSNREGMSSAWVGALSPFGGIILRMPCVRSSLGRCVHLRPLPMCRTGYERSWCVVKTAAQLGNASRPERNLVCPPGIGRRESILAKPHKQRPRERDRQTDLTLTGNVSGSPLCQVSLWGCVTAHS